MCLFQCAPFEWTNSAWMSFDHVKELRSSNHIHFSIQKEKTPSEMSAFRVNVICALLHGNKWDIFARLVDWSARFFWPHSVEQWSPFNFLDIWNSKRPLSSILNVTYNWKYFRWICRWNSILVECCSGIISEIYQSWPHLKDFVCIF